MGNPAISRRGERGFTLIETLAAAFVLMVGVLSTLVLLDRANATTTTNASREAGTNLARDLIEAARSIPYDQLNSGALNTKLQAMPGLDTSGPGPGYTIRRRNVDFTVEDSVCTMDDPADGGGSRPSGVNFCPQSVAPNTSKPGTTGKPDKNPEDYKLVTVKVSFTRAGVTRSVTQTGVVNNPGSSTGPSVIGISPSGWSAPYEITTDPTALTINIQTSSRANAISWSVDGSDQATAPTGDGTGTSWTVPWTIHPAGGTALDDGPYQLEAHAFNQYGVSGSSRSETIFLNRFKPRPPAHVAGGYNAQGGIDIEWDPNTERDIIGYEVRRTNDNTAICPLATQGLRTTCTDLAPPKLGTVSYQVLAYDKAPGTGQPRASDPTQLDVTNDDTPPFPPPTLTASTSNGITTLTWTRPSPSDPDTGDSIAFYRIYRDGTGTGDRYDRWFATGSTVTWQDTHTGGTQHRYWVSSVDQRFGESAPVGPVSG